MLSNIFSFLQGEGESQAEKKRKEEKKNRRQIRVSVGEIFRSIRACSDFRRKKKTKKWGGKLNKISGKNYLKRKMQIFLKIKFYFLFFLGWMYLC
jgi:hypothetical protein